MLTKTPGKTHRKAKKIIHKKVDPYEILTGETIDIADLTKDEKLFLGELFTNFKKNTNYLVFENLYLNPGSPVYKHAKRLSKSVSDTPLYIVCEDLGKRLGIQQGYLLSDEVIPTLKAESGEKKELTTGEVAKMAGCTSEAVRKAIRTGRLRARRVGHLSLIFEEDAKAFALSRKSQVG